MNRVEQVVKSQAVLILPARRFEGPIGLLAVRRPGVPAGQVLEQIRREEFFVIFLPFNLKIPPPLFQSALKPVIKIRDGIANEIRVVSDGPGIFRRYLYAPCEHGNLWPGNINQRDPSFNFMYFVVYFVIVYQRCKKQKIIAYGLHFKRQFGFIDGSRYVARLSEKKQSNRTCISHFFLRLGFRGLRGLEIS
ncbi:MAG TPA: hypothetical protein VFF31_31585 [Blastocatellia bacterium]|nr:hypothetical protein [Blastocatellia bacterium]